MKTVAALALLALVSGCAAVRARAPDGKTYTCVPNDPMKRGPFARTQPTGTALAVEEWSGSKPATEAVATK
jgi:hypothetical protein